MDTSDVYIAGPYTYSASRRKTETGITNPDGSTDGTTVVTVQPGTHNRMQPRGLRLPNIASLSGRSVQSVFVKRKTSTARYVVLFLGGTGTYQQCLFDFDTETVVENTAPHNLADHQQYNATDRMVERGVVKYPNGWYRLYLIIDTPAVIAGNGYGVGLAKDPVTSKSVNQTDDGPYDGTEAIYVWGLNRCSAEETDSSNVPLETNLSSYIKNSTTDASVVSRTPDIFTSTATEVLDRANGTKPAFFTKDGISVLAQGRYNNLSGNTHDLRRITQISAGNSQLLALYQSTQSNGDMQASIFGSLPPNSETFVGLDGVSGTNHNVYAQKSGRDNTTSRDLIWGVRYDRDNTRLYFNDGISTDTRQGSLDTTVTLRFTNNNQADSLDIGQNSNNSNQIMNGTIKRITLWKTPLTDNKLDKVTA